jgi:hypothetical protein
VTVAFSLRVGRTANLKVLHPSKDLQQLLGLGVTVKPQGLECQQQLVRGFKGGQAADLRLLLDDVPARLMGCEHDAGQPLKAPA